jgi:hypothetical protein
LSTNPPTVYRYAITEVFQLGRSNRRMLKLKKHNPCDTSVFDFYKVAIGGVIAMAQNFSCNYYHNSFIRQINKKIDRKAGKSVA